MDVGAWAHALRQKVRRFNGEFFRNKTAFPLAKQEIGELLAAARYNWREVDPSIFGALLEQALNPAERRKLGAHYTPRAYVERLVAATVIDPLREDWGAVVSTAERQKAEGRARDALATVRDFHDKLCATRVLDPACGTGNFLYVSLEMLKRLEGEVLEAVADLGGQEALTGLEGHSVDPHQFLGLEVNPRAAAIAELVLWIGHLQWHLRTKGGLPDDPVLRAFRNIVVKDAVLEADKELQRDAAGRPVVRKGADGETVEVYAYHNPRRPVWPEADFIVGNPPFIGKGEFMRLALGDEYIDALSEAHSEMNRSADYVMYWWDYAAEILSREGLAVRRFGFVTTNSIGQFFNRRVVERRIKAEKPISVVVAVPDHPWTKATNDAAAVRIAMTVCEAGRKDGVVKAIVREGALDTDTPQIEMTDAEGRVNSDLTVGADVTSAKPLNANLDLASMGPALGGRGFVLTGSEARMLGADASCGWAKRLTTGKDITGRHRERTVIDVRRYETQDALRRNLPRIYQHLRTTVYPQRVGNNDERLRNFWWRFRRSNETYFSFIEGLDRYIATVETTKHRVFVFVEGTDVLEHGVIGFGLRDAFHFGVMSSRIHVTWALGSGGTLEDRPRYNKDICFDPFPFPSTTGDQKQIISDKAEELNLHRTRALTEHHHITMTDLYNVLERFRAGEALDDVERRIFNDGLVLILKELHDKLDAAVADAYGWPADLADEDILARLVTLNKERAKRKRAASSAGYGPTTKSRASARRRRRLSLTSWAAARPQKRPQPPGRVLPSPATISPKPPPSWPRSPPRRVRSARMASPLCSRAGRSRRRSPPSWPHFRVRAS